MTVGAAIARRTGFRLLHNHQTIDLVLPYFEFGTAPFRRLVGEFRRRIVEEVAASDLAGLIFTYVRAFDEASDTATIEGLAQTFRERSGAVLFLELQATQEERLRRNEHADRLAAKPFKRDLLESRERLLALDAQYQLNSTGEFDGQADYFRVDNTSLTPHEVAERAIAAFGLATEGPR